MMDLIKCIYCNKKADKDFILVKFYKDIKIIGTELFCDIDCLNNYFKTILKK